MRDDVNLFNNYAWRQLDPIPTGFGWVFNVNSASDAAPVATLAPTSRAVLLFADGFESEDLSAWL